MDLIWTSEQITITLVNKKINFFVSRTSVGELICTFYAEFRDVYRMFLSGRVAKIQRNLTVPIVLYVLMKHAETVL
jgi:hypothetical protein